MSGDSDVDDISNDDQNRLTLHGRSAGSSASTSSSIVSATTIYTVASHRTADRARCYRKRAMSGDSDVDDISNDDHNRLTLHGRSAGSSVLTSSSIVSGTTIYTVASHRTADQARHYRKRILNQQRLAFRGTVLLLIFILVVTFMFTLFFQFDQTVSH
jgi:hypothetical protein